MLQCPKFIHMMFIYVVQSFCVFMTHDNVMECLEFVMESTECVTIDICWKLHTSCHNLLPTYITMHRTDVQEFHKHAAKISTHNIFTSKQGIFISNITCPRAQRPIFHHNRFSTTCSSTLQHVLQQHCLLQQKSYNLPTSTEKLQPWRWPTLRIVLHSHIHTQDKCSFQCLPYSCQLFPSPFSDFSLSYQFFPPPQGLQLSKLLRRSTQL